MYIGKWKIGLHKYPAYWRLGLTIYRTDSMFEICLFFWSINIWYRGTSKWADRWVKFVKWKPKKSLDK